MWIMVKPAGEYKMGALKAELALSICRFIHNNLQGWCSIASVRPKVKCHPKGFPYNEKCRFSIVSVWVREHTCCSIVSRHYSATAPVQYRGKDKEAGKPAYQQHSAPAAGSTVSGTNTLLPTSAPTVHFWNRYLKDRTVSGQFIIVIIITNAVVATVCLLSARTCGDEWSFLDEWETWSDTKLHGALHILGFELRWMLKYNL
jgi:hypothetical protein